MLHGGFSTRRTKITDKLHFERIFFFFFNFNASSYLNNNKS